MKTIEEWVGVSMDCLSQSQAEALEMVRIFFGENELPKAYVNEYDMIVFPNLTKLFKHGNGLFLQEKTLMINDKGSIDYWH